SHRRHGRIRHRHGRQQQYAGEFGEGVHRLCQGAARQAHLRLDRHRGARLSRGRTLMKETGTKLVHVPYRGGPAALNDLMGGSIDLLIEVFPVVMEQIKTGLIKGLAVSSPYRLPGLPNVPTFKQAGVAGVELTGWLGIYGPPRMPSDARVVLGRAIADIVKQGEI